MSASMSSMPASGPGSGSSAVSHGHGLHLSPRRYRSDTGHGLGTAGVTRFDLAGRSARSPGERQRHGTDDQRRGPHRQRRPSRLTTAAAINVATAKAPPTGHRADQSLHPSGMPGGLLNPAAPAGSRRTNRDVARRAGTTVHRSARRRSAVIPGSIVPPPDYRSTGPPSTRMRRLPDRHSTKLSVPGSTVVLDGPAYTAPNAQDLLADGLERCWHPAADPFAEELVVVPARGVERWLSQRLCRMCWATAWRRRRLRGGRVRSPASLIAEITGTRDDDPWSPGMMQVAAAVSRRLAPRRAWCRTLATHPANFCRRGEEAELRRGRRYGGPLTGRVVRLLTPGSVRNCWSTGSTVQPTDSTPTCNGSRRCIRALVDKMAIDPPARVRHTKTIARLRESGAELPAAVAVRSYPTRRYRHRARRCTRCTLRRAPVAAPIPARELWTAHCPAQTIESPRRDDTSHRSTRPSAAGHARPRPRGELQRSPPPRSPPTNSSAATTGPGPCWAGLQSDIALQNARRPQARIAGTDDRSVQVHSLPRPARQTGRAAGGAARPARRRPTLEPRDILVMCPTSRLSRR